MILLFHCAKKPKTYSVLILGFRLFAFGYFMRGLVNLSLSVYLFVKCLLFIDNAVSAKNKITHRVAAYNELRNYK